MSDHHSVHSTSTTPEKTRGVLRRWWRYLRWPLLLALLMTGAAIIGPLVLSQGHRAVAVSTFLQDWHGLFLAGHVLFVCSPLWWWPRYIRARAPVAKWSESQVQQLIQRKWWVVAALAVCALAINL